MKKILVACGTGMSTSTMIAHKLQEFLTEQGISATTAQCCLNEIPLNCNGMDLIVPETIAQRYQRAGCQLFLPHSIK
ncbi:hypothetical protein DF240_004140 [Escherichia coli O25]|nr:hypothetical protein [Escherichia coli O25]